MAESEYRHTQYGVLMFIVFLLSGVLIAFVLQEKFAEGRSIPALITLAIYFFGVASFYSFTIEIVDEKLNFWFGVGIFRKTYSLKEIESVTAIINPWYYVWGIKSVPGGWFYAIAPGEAVEIILKNGKVVQLGTDESEKLKGAIELAKQQTIN